MENPEFTDLDAAAGWRGLRLTRAGLFAVIVGLILIGFGLQLDYVELIGLGTALFLALLCGFAVILRRPTVVGERRIEPDRVVEGHEAASELTLTNRGRRSVSAGMVLERFGSRLLPVNLPILGAQQSTVIAVPLPTDRRGVYTVGPLAIERIDPFGLVRRKRSREATAELRVYPRIHAVDPFPSGMTRDLDGPNTGEAPEGGITFQNLRDYVPGDDLRLIHWRSAARTGTLMVRHNVDHHRPSSLIVLDTRGRVHSEESFEDALRAAASIAVSSQRRRFPFRIRTTCGRVLDHRNSRRQLLDTFAELTPTGVLELHEIASQAGRDSAGYSLAVITGRASVDDLAGLGPLRSRFQAMTIVRVGAASGTKTAYLPGAVLLNVGDSTEFTRAWQRRVRR